NVTSADLWALTCSGPQIGWAAGADGTILTTVNAGTVWVQRTTGVSVALRGVAFADPEVGLAVGDGATVLRSADGGITWSGVALSGVSASATLYATAISRDRTFAWVAGDNVLLRSVDGGNHFAAVAGLPATTWRSLRFASDAQHGVVVGDGGLVYLSRDGGVSWHAAAAAPAALRGVSITPDGARIVAVGAAGLIWRSADGGAHFARVDTTAPDLAAIGFIDDQPLQGWAVGAAGTILHTSDGGASFSPLTSSITANLAAVEDFN
ncbi:MAG: WD40/YVTN/BNR-like repeat-containing protein, partial [Polyangia bacterium]